MKLKLLRLANNSTYSNVRNPDLKRIVFKHVNFVEGKEYVEFYNEYFNLGKPESWHCAPCIRRSLEALRKIFTDDTEPEFEKEESVNN